MFKKEKQANEKEREREREGESYRDSERVIKVYTSPLLDVQCDQTGQSLKLLADNFFTQVV